jgi:pimeloyl-ACP methyl ester carboxylesterase
MTGATGGSEGLEPLTLDTASIPGPDPDAEPAGFVVVGDGGIRLHFLDWGGPAGAGALLLPGLLEPASSWAPVARRLARSRRTVVADLRGQGLSDSPMTGYDLGSLAADTIAVAEGSGMLGDAGVVLAGHGLGAVVALGAAARLGGRCAGLVLVDGGWERLEETTGLDVDEFLRGLDEPPEVLRSMDAYIADRRGFDPPTWDADQDRAARDAVVETAAGHVVRAVRPFVVEALVRTQFAIDPAPALAAVDAPVSVLVALASGDADVRLAELRRCGAARSAAGRGPLHVSGMPVAHNLMRYRPAEVAAAILGAARPGPGVAPGLPG